MELSHSQKNLIYDAVRYYQINKTVVIVILQRV